MRRASRPPRRPDIASADCLTPISDCSWYERLSLPKTTSGSIHGAVRRRISNGTFGRLPRERDFQRQLEARPMPSDDGLRLDNRHSIQRRRKQAIEPDEDQSVRHRQSRLRGHALTQHTQLVRINAFQRSSQKSALPVMLQTKSSTTSKAILKPTYKPAATKRSPINDTTHGVRRSDAMRPPFLRSTLIFVGRPTNAKSGDLTKSSMSCR